MADLELKPTTRIADMCKAFNQAFPYLRLEIYKKQEWEIQSEKNIIDINKKLNEVVKNFKACKVSLAPNRKVISFIEELGSLGLHAMIVFYKVDWIFDYRKPMRFGYEQYSLTLNQMNKELAKKGALANCW